VNGLPVPMAQCDIWYALPLIVAVSLAYAATRHERMRPIFGHALRAGLWIVSFMAIIFAVLKILSWMAT
jgi:hypothetical protein